MNWPDLAPNASLTLANWPVLMWIINKQAPKINTHQTEIDVFSWMSDLRNNIYVLYCNKKECSHHICNDVLVTVINAYFKT